MAAIVENHEQRPWHRVYREFNISAKLPAIDARSLADYVEDHARNRGNLPALEYFGVTISYRQLDEYANRFANVLMSLGLKKNDVIGLHLPNMPQYVVALVGAAKLGCVVSGVSPLLTPPEIIHQVNDAGIKLLVTLDRLYNQSVAPADGQMPLLKHVLVSGPIDFLPGLKKWLAYTLKKVEKISLKPMTNAQRHDYWTLLTRASNARVHTTIAFDDTIYVQYTGGTTGKPKGAELTLYSMFANARQADAFNPFKQGREVIGAVFPLFHMAGLAILLMSLQSGVCFLLIPDPRNVKHFCKTMQKLPPTVLTNVPTLYMMLVDEPEFKKIDFSRLRVALSGAAPFPPEAIRKLEAIIGHGKLCEVYGMTEASPLLTSNPPAGPKVGTVGVPVVGTDIRIVDVETGLEEMPLGEPGEIIARGPQIMKGYLNLPEASRQMLREFQGERWLYTGDVGFMDRDGYITLCDRSKDMLIVGGYKVFSVEIESKLKELPIIELSALIGEKDPKRPGNDVVTLHVQLTVAARKRDRVEVEAEILKFCYDTMARFKVPKKIYFHDALPLTAVGKLDKKALRK